MLCTHGGASRKCITPKRDTCGSGYLLGKCGRGYTHEATEQQEGQQGTCIRLSLRYAAAPPSLLTAGTSCTILHQATPSLSAAGGASRGASTLDGFLQRAGSRRHIRAKRISFCPPASPRLDVK